MVDLEHNLGLYHPVQGFQLLALPPNLTKCKQKGLLQALEGLLQLKTGPGIIHVLSENKRGICRGGISGTSEKHVKHSATVQSHSVSRAFPST